MSTFWKSLDRRRNARRSTPTHARRRLRATDRMQLEPLEARALLAVTLPPSISSDTVEIDDNLVVADGNWSVTATGGPSSNGHVQIFGNSRGRIDGTAGQSDEDLTINANAFITVTGAIGATNRIDDLTLTSTTAQPVNLQQAVFLTGDLRVTNAGALTIGSTVDVDGNLVIDAATNVLFSGNVNVDGNLTITNASSIIFAGTLTVGGQLTISNVTGSTRFVGDVSVGAAAITSTTLVQVQASFISTGLAGDGDVTFTTDQIGFSSGTIESSALSGSDPSATLTVKPRTTSRDLTIASPPGIPSGVNITDADLFAIQPGWKRVVFGDEAAGTGAVRIGSIGSQYGGFSQILNTTTIVGGTIQVVQPVDVTSLATYLELIARGTGSPGSGAVTIDAPINQTAEERNDWVRLTSAGSISINAPIWSAQTVSLTTTTGGTITQGGSSAAVTTVGLAIDADGSVTLADSGNAISLVAIKTTNDSVVLREDSGYNIAQITTNDDERDVPQIATVTGINVGSATVRLVTISGQTASTVGQGRAILAGGLGLEGANTDWLLTLSTNDVATLAANTGSIDFRDVDDLTIDTVAAVTPQSSLAGITVARTVSATAGTTLTITAAGDIVSAASSGTAVSLTAPSGISTAGAIETSGADAVFNNATTLTGDVVVDLENGPARGTMLFMSTVQGTTSGQESLTIGGNLDARASIGSTTALEALSVSGDSTLAAGITLRTAGNQTYSGAATSTGTVTIQAGSGSTVGFLGNVSLGGLVTATGDTAAYNVALTGSPVSVTNAVTFANTGTVTLGDADTDSLTFGGGLTSTAPSLTNLAGTIATTNTNASFGTTALTADTTVSTGAGNAGFEDTVDGTHALTVNAAGDTTFGRMVGFTTPLVSLVTDSAGTTRLNGSTVKTSGAAGMVFNDPVVLGAITDLTASNEGAITFASTLDGAYSLAARTAGTTTFGGAVGSVSPLTLLSTDAGGETRINGGSVRTSGSIGQNYGDAIVLGADATLTATNAGLVIFASTVNGGHALAVNTAGLAIFGGPVGGTTPLASLVTDATGTTKIAGGSVTTSGVAGQVYNDAVELQVNTTLTAQASGPITFANTLDGTCTLNADTEGTTTFGGAVGSSMALGGITTDAGGTTRINGGSVRTAFAAGQVYGDAAVLGANTTLTALNTGVIRFADSLNGAFALAANTQGSTAFDGAVGGTTALVSLATDAGGTTYLSGGSITTADAAGQVYNDVVELQANTTLTAQASGPITFANTLNGAFTLTANTQGTTTFGGAVGGTAALVSLDTDVGGTTAIDGGSVTTSGASGQIYRDAVVLAVADATLAAGGNGLVLFASTVDGGRGLTVDTQGETWFAGVVGGQTPLASLTTDAGGITRITADTVKTVGNQTYNDRVTFEQPLSPSSISLLSIPETLMVGSTVSLQQGLEAAGRSLRIEGNAVFGDQPGSPPATTNPDSFVDAILGLNGLTVTGSTTINSNAVGSGVVAPTNPITFQGPVTLGSDVAVVGGGVRFQSTVAGPSRSFRVGSAASGSSSSIVFDGDVGTLASPLGPIEVLCLDGSVIINAAIHSTGPVTITALTIDGDADNAIRVPTGTIALQAALGIGATTPIAVEATSVTATTSGGGIRLRGIGDLVIGAAGLSAPDTISLAASGSIRVPTGGTIAGGDVTSTKEIRWSVLNTGSSGAGSLPQVLTNINAVGDCNPSGTDAVVVIDLVGPLNGSTPTVIQLTSQLPDVAAAVTLDGTASRLVLDGGRTISSGLVYPGAGSGSVLRGVTLRNFTGFGVQLVSAQNVTVDTITVQSLNTSTSMGLFATGTLTGSRIIASSFSGGLRGALLVSARNLAFGELGRGNMLANNRAAPSQPRFAGTGIRSEGDCTGTVVEGNTFTNNNFGFAFIGARNLALRNNTFTRNSIAGIYIEADSSGSTQTGNTFGTRNQRNKVNVLRAKHSRFG